MPKISSLSLQEIDHYIYKYQLQQAQMPENENLARILTSLYTRKQQLLAESAQTHQEQVKSPTPTPTPTLRIVTRTATGNTGPTKSTNLVNNQSVNISDMQFSLKQNPTKTQIQETTATQPPVVEKRNTTNSQNNFQEFNYKNYNPQDNQEEIPENHPVAINVQEYLEEAPALEQEKPPIQKSSQDMPRPLPHTLAKMPPVDDQLVEEEDNSEKIEEKFEDDGHTDNKEKEQQEDVVVSTPDKIFKFAKSPYQMAPLIERAKATTIDYCLIIVGYWASNMIPMELALILRDLLKTNLFLKNLLPLQIIWLVAIIAFYYLFLMKEGQSYGKKILRLRVVNDNDDPLLTRETIVRRELLGKSASILMGFYGFYQAYQDKENQLTFHDNFSHTRVILEEKKSITPLAK